MKRLFTLLAILMLVLSFGMNEKNAIAATPDQWLDQDAKVSKEVYDLLLDRAGFASYIYTDTKVSMDPENLSTFIMEEKHDDFFIGKLASYTNTNKILVTKDGLIVSFTPKEYAHTTFENNRHFIEVQTAVKIFVGPTIKEANYINFASLNSNKATSIYTSAQRNLIVPSNITINHIGYSWTSNNTFDPNDYGTILPGSLQAGTTHTVRSYGRIIDGILVYNKGSTNAMNIFYTSNSPIVVESASNSRTLALTNNFVIEGQEPINKLENLQISAANTNMVIGDSQTVTVNGKYTDGTSKQIDHAQISWNSTNSNIADFRNGKLVALSPGNTRLIAQYEGKTATLDIRVLDGNFKELPHKLNVNANKKWKINFSAAVDLSTVVDNNIYITDEQGNKISAYHSTINDKTIQIIPDENFDAGKTYTVWVKDLKSTSGKTLQQNTKMKFTVRN